MAFAETRFRNGAKCNPDSYRPPMWSAQLFGEPYGEWTDPKQYQKLPGMCKVWDNENVSNGRVVQIEMAIRKLVDMRKEPSEMGWQHLFELLKVGDNGRKRRSGKIDLPVFRRIVQKTFRRHQFTITEEETIALFMKYGHDAYGAMPYEMFSRRIFSGQAHQLSLEGCKKRAFDATNDKDWSWQGMIKYPICRTGVFAPADWEDYSHKACRRSACLGLKDRKPEAYLKLEHVFGYSSPKNKAPNLFYTEKGDIVYYTASVGIVYDDDNNRQKFFLRHDDDIQCLAIAPDLDTVATGQVGAEPVVWIWSASTLKGPQDPTGREQPIMLQLPYGHRGVIVCGFDRTGAKLATVSTDDEHTVTIWDWKSQTVEAQGTACQGIPPMCWGIVWNPFAGDAGAHPADFCTLGIKHINFWTMGGATGLESGAASFDVCEQDDILVACFLPTNHCLTGSPNGRIYAFEDGMGIKSVQAHNRGKVIDDDPENDVRFGGVHTLRLTSDKEHVLSGGGDGKIKQWKIETTPSFNLVETKVFDLKDVDPDGPPRKFTGLDIMPGQDTFVAADSENDIWEIDDDPRVMVEGQSGDVNGLAAYPVEGNEHLYATTSHDGCVYLWDANRRENLRSMEMRRTRDCKPKGCKKGDLLKVQAVAFSAKGDMIAVTSAGVVPTLLYEDDPDRITLVGWDHVDKGGVLQVWEAPEEMFVDDAFQDEEFIPKVLFEVKHNEEPIDDVKFSPDGRYVATGSHDNWIDIYQVGGSWKRIGRCAGHSSWISHLDWSQDSSVIQSTDAAYEMLYWKVNGEQQTVCQRDQSWATWTCTLGFPVMGIWRDGMGGSDINSVDRSKNVNRNGKPLSEFLVAADDNGKVHLFNYPCVIEDAPGHAFKGHASHVSNIRFSADDKRVFSTGGHDRSLFQWKTHGVTEPSRHFKREAKRPVPRDGGGGGTASRGGTHEFLKLQLEVRELQRDTGDQKKVIQERDEEIARLMERLAD